MPTPRRSATSTAVRSSPKSATGAKSISPSNRTRFMLESVAEPLAAITSRSFSSVVRAPQEPTRMTDLTPYSVISSWV
jgi:hypothetical protein